MAPEVTLGQQYNEKVTSLEHLQNSPCHCVLVAACNK